MTCEACAAHQSNPLSGIYHFDCLDCCARAVISARPSRRLQEVMLQAVCSGRPKDWREKVLARVKELTS